MNSCSRVILTWSRGSKLRMLKRFCSSSKSNTESFASLSQDLTIKLSEDSSKSGHEIRSIDLKIQERLDEKKHQFATSQFETFLDLLKKDATNQHYWFNVSRQLDNSLKGLLY